jgi:hypothetical protein
MNPISLMHHRKLLLPSSRSHWNATEPRSKTQPTATVHTHSGNTHDTTAGSPNRSGRFLKTGQTASVGLSLTQAGETGQAGLANRSDRFCPETLQRPKHLKSLPISEQMKPLYNRDFLAQKPFWTAHREKPVRPVWETGQAGFCLDSWEEHSPREKLKTPSNRSPDSFHGSKWDFGDRRGTSWATLG